MYVFSPLVTLVDKIRNIFWNVFVINELIFVAQHIIVNISMAQLTSQEMIENIVMVMNQGTIEKEINLAVQESTCYIYLKLNYILRSASPNYVFILIEQNFK